MPTEPNPSPEQLRYLQLLAEKYPTIAAASSEIINLEALCRLPKGTEHFMSDLHGENEAFIHILNSASGVIREKIGCGAGGEGSRRRPGRAGHADLLSGPETARAQGQTDRPERLVPQKSALAD